MTATVSTTNGWCPETLTTQLGTGYTAPEAASAQGGMGQAMYFDASGNVALNDGTVPGLVCAGVVYPDKITATSTIAGACQAMLYQGMGGGNAASTISLDSFTAADVMTPCFDAGNGVPGKLSNSGGSNRSILGIVFGLYDNGNPRYWAGPVASLLARWLLSANATALAGYSIADAAANTATAERAIRRPKIKGTVTDISFVGAAVAADATDYDTITISKRDGAGGAAVVLGTYSTATGSNGAITAFTRAPFTLSVVAGALYLLETDIVTITVAKAAAGKGLTGDILVNGKAI